MQRRPALDAATLDTLLSAAVAAPSIHNTQPWQFGLDPRRCTVEVRAAKERMLPLADPEGRALHVSVGAAVFNLQVAAAHLGWDPVVRLLPRPEQPDLLALVGPADPPSAEPAPWAELFGAIRRRHSSRRPFTDEAVPDPVLDELAEAARLHDAVLRRPGPAESARLLALTADAELRRTGDPARLEETRSWLTESGEPLGIPYAVLGPTDARAHLPVREFTGLESGRRRPAARFEEHPRLLTLATHGDEPGDWLRAGQALEHVLLLATVHGLRVSMLYQAMEWSDLRWLLRDPVESGWGRVQMLLRLGYGPEGPATPRRPWTEALTPGSRRQ